MGKKGLFSALSIAFLTLITVMPITAENASGVIRVKVTGVRYAQGGNLVLTLYNSEDSWFVLEKIYAYKIVKVTGDTLTVDFDNIPYADTYALFVFHDANGNNMLDFSWFPFPHPKEGVAVSNNAVRMGEPYYSKARFSINSNECLMEIKMHY